MRARAIIHQQVCQLRWHLLACLGLIMVLPIEEAVVTFRAGDGFHSVGLAIGAAMFGPLLAGLIACANVQGDLSEKRYIFWRSKPANVKKLMALKFFIGLILSLAIIACPLVFAVVSSSLCGKDLNDDLSLKYSAPVLVIIAVMTYSLCFGCNVLVRNTARSWLIGMLLAGFVLVFPFMLPLGFKDVVSDVGLRAWGFYPATILVTSVAAFVFALYAAEHDWHLRTNLRELLWVGTGLVFLLLILFSSQVANIRVLDEKEIESPWQPYSLDKVEGKPIFQGRSYVNASKSSISLDRFIDKSNPGIKYRLAWRTGNRYFRTYPRTGGLYKKSGNDLYAFVIHSHYRREKNYKDLYENLYENLYLRSYKLTSGSWKQAGELDLSDCLTSKTKYPLAAMRLIDNTLVVCVRGSYVVVDVTDPAEPKQIDKKLDVLNVLIGSRRLEYEDRQREFSIPLVPLEQITTEERIKLSIDLRYRLSHPHNNIYESSIVDIHDGKFAFFSVSDREVARFDVIRWDREKVYCKFSSARPFTILEGMTGATSYLIDHTFVENGKLYLTRLNTLLVFDVRVSRRIRKLGHFVRMDWHIEDLAVLDNGNMLLSAQWLDYMGAGHYEVRKRYLCLLKNPK